jgi:hypothetical protein
MESPEVDFEEVEVQEWVCKKQILSDQEKPVESLAGKGDNPAESVDIASQSIPNAEPNAADTSAEKQYTLVKIVHTKLFCPLHNTVGIVHSFLLIWANICHLSFRLYRRPGARQRRNCYERKF